MTGTFRFSFEHRLDEPARALLRTKLDVMYTDEDEPRPGTSWLAPDLRAVVSAGDVANRWTLTVHPVGRTITSDEWLIAQVREALAEIDALVLSEQRS